jgi:hypothetical protein
MMSVLIGLPMPFTRRGSVRSHRQAETVYEAYCNPRLHISITAPKGRISGI